jgi:hypothetical protein
MAETETSKPELWVKIAGERIQLVIPGMGWTFEEADAAMAVSGGLAPVEIETRLLVTDPRAWRAVLRVSFMRARKEYPAEAVDEQDIIELGNVVTEAILAELQKLPPTNQSGNESSDPAESSELEEGAARP